MDNPPFPRKGLLGVFVSEITNVSLDEAIKGYISSHAHVLVLNVNIRAINLAYQLPWLHDFFNSAPIVFCDGFGVLLGLRLLGHRIPYRITYADWMWELAEFCQENGFSLFFLGAGPGIAFAASNALKAKFPALRIAGTHHGYFDQSRDSQENQGVIRSINDLKPDILVVGFGMPRQERWLMENWQSIDAHVALTGGAVFDYVSGKLHRAPAWMTDHGLEWLGRLVIEPRRLWKRYLIGIPLFFFRVLKQRLGLIKFF